jgi:thioredoxin 1
MLELTSQNFKAEVEEHSGLVVIDLYADWCGPCKMLAPTLHALEEEYPEVKFAKVNVDKETALAMQFKVQSIPFVAFVKDNTFLDMSVGYVPADKLRKMIEQYK